MLMEVAMEILPALILATFSATMESFSLDFLRYDLPLKGHFELTTIYHGLHMIIDIGIDVLACYSNSLLSINLIKGDIPHFHVYDVLIQNIKDISATNNFTADHTLR